MGVKKILVTGASGFIGSFIVEEALKQGFETWAAVRKSSSRKYLSDGRLRFIELDFSSEERMKQQLGGLDFDYVVHAAGVTKCSKTSQFYDVNRDGTYYFAKAVAATCPDLRRFVFLSSLSVMGAIREDVPHTELKASDTPCPNTAYGQSKLSAERLLSSVEGLPYIVLRPTGVYGPREKDYFMMMKSISRHVDFVPGLEPQDLTFIYVKDLVQAVMLALDNGKTGSCYLLSDGKVYSSRAFSDLVRRELGNPWLLRLKAPLWFLHAVTSVCGYFGKLTGSVTALNNDKYNIMKQRNWRCDISQAVAELGYKPEYDLDRGVREAVAWYKENKWL